MLNNILKYIIEIFAFIGQIGLRLFGLACEGIMFLAMFICGALGFGVFVLFLGFMILSCLIALGL